MPPSIPYDRLLNARQREAVAYDGSPLLVLAGAGSGKTRVITFKIAFLIHERGVRPGDILAVTFTNKAAGEMKERVQALLGEDMEVWIRTFHSTAAKCLRIMGNQCGVRPGFAIIDQQDQLSLVKKIMKDLNIDPEVYRPEKYSSLIERAKDRILDPEEALKEGFSTDQLFYDIYRVYEDKLEKENLLDFGDLIGKLSRGLDRNEPALAYLKGRFKYILVDEFQDTNFAQYTLVKQLSLPEGNICVVGDDDQSIYGFRGARVENILNFPKDFEGTKLIKLEENYRSYQTILSASSEVINNNADRLGKTLYTNKGEGEKITFYLAPSDYGEALAIANEIRHITEVSGRVFADIAVFYRTNAQSRVFESVFSQMRIPYVIVGGLRFYEREEVKDMLAYLRLSLNPFDEVSLRRIADKPPRGIGEKTVDAILRATVEKGLPIHGGEAPEIGAGRVRLVADFLRFLGELGEKARGEAPPDALKHLYDTAGYLDWLERDNKDEKLKNLEELYNAVDEFSKNNPGLPIADFIEEASLNQGAGEEGAVTDRVFLITLHNAKGLEFPVVFIAGMEEGVFPHFLSGESLQDMQEERRLFYVGMTRAMERLYLTAAKVRKLFGRSVERGVSSFVYEIPRELMVWKESARVYADRSETTSSGTIPGKRRASPVYAGSPFARHPSKETSRSGSAAKASPPEGRGRVALDLEVNNRVLHKGFGRGVVLATNGEIAEIQFDDGKRMKFMLKYTPLVKE
jgi:DNA helicase-2/ATP-dependent DNA helicase PcrA